MSTCIEYIQVYVDNGADKYIIIPYMIDQTPQLLLISARNMVRLLFEKFIFESGVYFVKRLRGCDYNLQRDTGALYSLVQDRSVLAQVGLLFEGGIYLRAASVYGTHRGKMVNVGLWIMAKRLD